MVLLAPDVIMPAADSADGNGTLARIIHERSALVSDRALSLLRF